MVLGLSRRWRRGCRSGWTGFAALASLLASALCVVAATRGLGAAAECTVADARDSLPVRCDSLPPAADTVVVDVFLTLEAPLRKDTLPPEYMPMVLDALLHRFAVPRPWAMLAFHSGPGRVGDTAFELKMMPVAFGEMAFKLDSAGATSDVRVTQSSLSPAIDRALISMASGTDSTHPFPSAAGVVGPKPVQFVAALESRARSSGARTVHGSNSVDSSPGANPKARLALLRTRVPRWSQARPAAALNHGAKVPTYPPAALHARTRRQCDG